MTQPSEPKADILLVDDLPENLLVYRCVLEELGQNLVFARSGEEALGHLLQGEFAVILLDVNMPGMDGFETAMLIRQRKKSARTPIIFLTAFPDDLPAARGYATGAVDFMSAPVIPDVLRAKVRVFVELFQLRQQTAKQAEERVRRTVAEDAARRSAFLAEAGNALVSSLDFETTLDALTRVSIPFLADLSIVCLPDGPTTPGRIDVRTEQRDAATPCGPIDSDRLVIARQASHWSRVEWAWIDATSSKASLASGEAPAALEKMFKRVLDTGMPSRLKESICVRLPTNSCGEGNGESLARREMNLGDVFVLPLSVRGKTHGALCLARAVQRSSFAEDDLRLAHELASRAGMAIENTLLVRSIQDADRRKDEFLAMLAHELRNPLAPIRNAVQLLRVVSPESDDLQQARDLIDRQVTHLVRLVDDLLDATRIARGKVELRKERCDVSRIVRQVAEDYRPLFADSGLTLVVDVAEEPIWVDGDPTRLTQIVSNLLNNASKFTDRGGDVAVGLDRQADGRRATLRVRDTGIGIDPRMLSSIFDVFVQADRSLERVRGGLGLGLSLVKGLVDLHGGDVLANSGGLGRGAEFVVHLPLATKSSSAAASLPPDAAPLGCGAKHRVLVVDDNRDAAHSAATLLELAGHIVRTAYTGADGLAVAGEFRPDVMLCDIGLPGGMSGYDVARAIRQDVDLPAIYLIAVTGYGRDEDHRQAEEAGFDLHLTKPVDCQRLFDILAQLPQGVELGSCSG
jgi:signal transduction histidine kinase/DNA-binding response OmpR family regulator